MKHWLWLGAGLCLIFPRWAAADEAKPDDAPAKDEKSENADAADASSAKSDAGEAKEKSGGVPEKKEEAEPTYGHGRQFGLRVGLVGGYRMVFRYDNSPYCHEPDLKKQPKDQQKFCGFGAPLATEVALSFAPIDGIEPFAFGRFGLQSEKATDTKALLAFGAGLRIYTMSDSAFKVFIEPAVGVELEGGGSDPLWQTAGPGYNPQYKKDMLFHLAAGPQYDFAKNVGVYLDAGLTTGILRAIHSNLEVQGGLQFRAP